jgi:hypothetical protein
VVDIVGAGRVGLALQARAEAAGAAGALWTRAEAPAWTMDGDAPILVCTRNDDVAAVIARTPARRRDDLVFVQNGMIRPALTELGVGGCTRGLLFLAVPARGDDATPGGVSPFSGPRAAEVAAWLSGIGVPAAAVDDAALRALELEKLLWIVVMGAVCDARGCSVGEAAGSDDVAALTAELAPLAAAALGTEAPVDELVARLDQYSRSIPAWRAAVRELPWRNGWFVEAAAAAGVSLPVHARLMALAGKAAVGDPAVVRRRT